MTFTVRIQVRNADLDTNGHVRGPKYLEYADQARWECVQAAGVRLDALAAAHLGPVNLETTIRFEREIRGGEIKVVTEFEYHGKTGRVHQELCADGTRLAAVHSVTGLLDLRTRRLVPDAERIGAFATEPGLLGL
ncbi:acyl-CoA thioesterase [Sciscionella sediminilitoris]|uniref:acyl-CoA thioesterase n=1 Tax=Sciscionella sediminilitoris TaxID=1445613 RepID=UPI0004DFBDB0|nr:thioesterase family protein [Sciscionella sp. SE31]